MALVAGADLVKTMSTPGVWSQEDLDKILSVYGVFMYGLLISCSSLLCSPVIVQCPTSP